MKKLTWIAIILFGLFVFSVNTGLAQTSTLYDFSVSDGGWVGYDPDGYGADPDSVYSAACCWQGTWSAATGTWQGIYRVFPSAQTVTGIEIVFTHEQQFYLNLDCYEHVGDTPSALVSNFYGSSTNSTVNESFTGASCEKVTVVFAPNVQGAVTSDIYSIELFGVDDDGGGGAPAEPFQPINADLQVSADVPRDDDDLVNGTSVITATTRDSTIGGTVPVYAPVEAHVVFVSPYAPHQVELSATVDGEDWTIKYRNLETVYIQAGDDVDAGCIIGLAGPYTTPVETDETDLKAISFSIVNDDELSFEDWTLYQSPDGVRICGSLLQSDSCVTNNPYMGEFASGWTLNRGLSGDLPTAYAGYVHLPGTTSLSQYVALEPDTSYYVTLGIVLVDRPSGVVNVSIGDATIEQQVYADRVGDPSVFGVRVGEQQILLLGPFDPTTPDLVDDLYNFIIENAFLDYSIDITYACVHGTSDSPIAPYPACYFNQLSDLATTGEILTDPLGTDYVALQDTETLYAPSLSLSGYSDADAHYNVEVVVSASALNADDEPGTNPDLVLSYDDLGYSTAVTIPASTRKFTLLTYNIEVPQGETFTSDLTLTHDQQLTTDSEYIYISAVCLYPITGQWPGYEPPPSGGAGGGGAGGGGPGGSTGACAPVIAPATTDVWQWVLWLFASLEHFFKCVLPAELLKILNAVLSIFALIGKVATWLAAVFQLFGNWIFALIGWAINGLAGLIASLLQTIWNAIIGLDVFKWLFDNLSLAGIVFSLMAELGQAILTGVINAIKVLATLAQLIAILWGYILAGINGTTVVETGIPSCVDLAGDNFFYPLCAFNGLIDYGFELFPGLWAFVIVASVIIILSTFDLARKWIATQFSEVS